MNTTEGENNQHHRPGKQLPRDFCSWRQVWRHFFWVELCSLRSVHFIGIAQATFLKVENVTRVQQSLSRQKSNVVKESMRKCTARVVVIVLTILWQVLGQRHLHNQVRVGVACCRLWLPFLSVLRLPVREVLGGVSNSEGRGPKGLSILCRAGAVFLLHLPLCWPRVEWPPPHFVLWQMALSLLECGHFLFLLRFASLCLQN